MSFDPDDKEELTPEARIIPAEVAVTHIEDTSSVTKVDLIATMPREPESQRSILGSDE